MSSIEDYGDVFFDPYEFIGWVGRRDKWYRKANKFGQAMKLEINLIPEHMREYFNTIPRIPDVHLYGEEITPDSSPFMDLPDDVPQVFIIVAEDEETEEPITYLVNTEGYDYARYIVELV